MKNSTFTKHIIYWILPLVILLPCIVLYCVDPSGAGRFIAPPVNREFGVLENLQLLLIALIFFTALRAVRQTSVSAKRLAFMILAGLAVFVFLEEIDYGLHYYEYAIGKTSEQAAYELVIEKRIRNVHNIGKANSVIKFLVYLAMIMLFAVLPLLPKRIKQRIPLLAYLSPSTFIVTTGMVLLLLNGVTAWFQSRIVAQHHSLAGNLSEFEETMTYYIFFLYCREMAVKPIFTAAAKWNWTLFNLPHAQGSFTREKRRTTSHHQRSME